MTTPSSIPAPHPAHQSAPRHDLTSGLRFLEELVQHMSLRSSYTEETSTHSFVPRFDVEIHPASYELYGELPGFDHDHVTVEANDDRNIQISGWISRSRQPDAATDPVLAVLHNDPVPPKPQALPTARFGDELDPHAEYVHDPPATTAAAEPAAITAPTTAATSKPSRPATARFGDELDPHAQYVHRPAAKGPQTRYLMAERRYGQFHRAFHFPGPFRKEEVVARMDNGILHVTAPKAAVGPPTKVEVKKGGQ